MTAASLPLSNFGMSQGQFIMAGGWMLAGNLPQRLHKAIRQPAFWLLTGLFLLHLAGLLNTEDFKYAGKDIRVKIPLLLMPILIAAGPELTLKQIRITIITLMTGVLASTLAGYASYLGLTGHEVKGFRDLSLFISHIRLSLLIDVCLVLTIYLFFEIKAISARVLLLAYGCWMIYFLFLLQSITGLLILATLFAAALFSITRNNYPPALRLTTFALLCTMVVGVWKLYDYVFIKSIAVADINLQGLPTHTPRGNPYKHDLSRYDMENGRYVWVQYNDLEMDTAWMQRSPQRVWYNDAQGNMQLVTLARFLTYKGYSKDAAGIQRLSDEEVKIIEAGYPTPEYLPGKQGLRFRLKELADEYRIYHFNGWATGHTLTQRLEYWKTARWIIHKNPLTGVGTGDLPTAFENAYKETNSSLSKEWQLRAHNQYLSIGVAFGYPGLIFFCGILLYLVIIALQRHDYIYTAFLLIAIVSFLTEDTLETQAGATFFAFLNCFFLWRKKPEDAIQANWNTVGKN